MHHGQIEVLWVCPSCRELSIKVITRSTWRLTVHAADPLWLMCGTRGPDFQQVRKFEQEFQQHSEASCSTTRFQLSFSGKSYKVWGEHSSRIFGGSPRNKRHPSLIWPWFCHFFFYFSNIILSSWILVYPLERRPASIFSESYPWRIQQQCCAWSSRK